jgi:hypothetical protein
MDDNRDLMYYYKYLVVLFILIILIISFSTLEYHQLVSAQGISKEERNNSQLSFWDIFIRLAIAVIGISAAVAAFLWTSIQSWQKKRYFKKLICRELQELHLYCEYSSDSNWYDHQKRKFVHKDIFNDPKQNFDFIISLDNDIVYHVSQLWNSLKNDEPYEWIHHLYNLAKKFNDKEIIENWDKWTKLIIKYKGYQNDNKILAKLSGFYIDLRYPQHELKLKKIQDSMEKIIEKEKLIKRVNEKESDDLLEKRYNEFKVKMEI